MADIKKFQFILDGKIANNFKSELNKLGGTISGLSDTQVVVNFDENATTANFKKLYQQLEKENSDLTVQFRYDINKMMLEKAQKELSSLEIYVDSDKANKEILELVKGLKDINLKLDVEDLPESEANKLYKQGEKIADKIGKIISTHISIDGTDKIFNDLSNEVKAIIGTFTNLNNIKSIEPVIIDTKKLEKQRKEVEDIVTAMTVLESKGASPVVGSGSIDDSKIEELRKEITEVKEDISSLKGRVDTLEDVTGFDSLTSDAKDFNKEIKDINSSAIDLQKALIPLYDGINKVYQDKNGKRISGYWDELKKQIDESDGELKELLKTIGLYDSKTDSLNLIATGNKNSGGLIGDNKVLISRKKDLTSFEGTLKLKEKLDEAYKAGVNVSRILDVIGTKDSDVFLEIQERNTDSILGDINSANKADDWINPDIFSATDEQVKKLISDLIKLRELGVGADIHESNVLFSKENGFSLIDLDLEPAKYENYSEMVNDIVGGLVGAYEIYYDETEKLSAKEKADGQNLVEQFRERFTKLAEVMQQAYAQAQDSSSPSKEFEKLENDAVDGIVEGANKNEDRLKNVGKQMADNIKEGFKEGVSEIGATALSGENQSSVLSGNQTEVLSGNNVQSAIDGQNELQKELIESKKYALELTNEFGEIIEVYRGLRNMIGDGSSSNRYHGGTFWTSDKGLAQNYGDKLTHATLSMNNPLIYRGQGEEWDQLVLYEKQLEKASEHITILDQQANELLIKIEGMNPLSQELMPQFDFVEGSIINYKSDAIDTIHSLEEFKDAFLWIENFNAPQVQNYILQLYDIFKTIARLDELVNKGVLNTNEVTEIAKALKYDGVVFQNILDGAPSPSDIFVTFEQEQVHVIDTISAAQLKLEEEHQRVKEFTDTRRNLYETIKALNDEQLDTYITNATIEFQSVGLMTDSLIEVLDKQNPSDTFINIKNAIKNYFDEIVKEFDGELNQTPLSLVEESSGQFAIFDGVEEQQKEVKAAIEKTNDAIEGQITLVDYLNDQKNKPVEPIKDTFDETPEASKMDKVTTATEEAVQAKKDFAIANEGVQDSVDGSKSKLELETELMERLAQSAREAADAKKEFVKANKEVKDEEETSEVKKSKTGETIDKISSYNKTDSFFSYVKNDKLESKRYQNIKKEIESIIQKQGKFSAAVNATEEEIQELDDATKAFADGFEKEFQKQQLALADNLENKLARITSGKVFDEDNTKIISNIESNIDQLRDITIFDANDLSTASQVSELIQKINTEINQIKNVSNNPIALLPQPEEIHKSIGQINKALSGGFKMPRQLRDDFKALKLAYDNAFDSNGNVKITNAELQKLDNTLSKLNAEFEATGKHKSIMGSLTSRITDMNAKFLAQYFSFQDIVRYGQQGFETIKEYDKALTEMNKVSDESIHTLKEFQNESFELANKIGTTAVQIQNSTADWMRLGESLEEAKQSAQDANILFNVSEFESIDEATESLVAMSAAYDELEKIEIVDIMNQIGNNYAISTDELSSALQKSAATLKVAGNDIYEATALITAGNAVLQDADTVGTGLKMISLRILGTEEAKNELASLGEDVDDFVVQTQSKLDETIRNYTAVASNNFQGISILDENGNYKSTYEILKDISEVYQEILETDKKAGTNRGQALLEVLAGENFCLKFMETYIYRTHLIARIA